MKKINANFIIGLFFIILGLLITLNYLDIIVDVNYSVIFWSFVCLTGLGIALNEQKFTTIPSLMVVVGLWNTLKEVGIIEYSIFNFIWPICLFTIGISLVFSNNLFSKRTQNQTSDKNIKESKLNNKNVLVFNGIFSGVEQRLSTNPFNGLNATALFGGVELDLRDIVVIDKEVYIEASAFFGGVTFIMPDNKYNIIVDDSLAIFGGIENKYKGIFNENNNTIIINSKAMFGGVEIK